MKQVLKRGLSLLLTLVLAFGVVSAGGGAFQAAALTRDEAVAWARTQGDNGAAYDLNGDYGNGGYQCSDFVSAYMNYLIDGNPRSGRYGVYNANYYDTVASWNPNYWEIITNYAALVPQPGDIFVSKYGTYGHVGVVISSTASTAEVVDQNSKNPNYTTGCPAWKHTITWTSNNTSAYGAACFIRFKGFVTHTCDYKASATVTKAPTRTATGTRVRTCSCGKTMTETIPAIPYTTDLKEGIYKIESKLKSNMLMTCFSGSSDLNVAVYTNPGTDGYWLFRKNSDGTYTIENAYLNGKVLDVHGVSMVKCANIYVYDDCGGDNQKFYVIPEGNYYRLVAKHSYQTVDVYNAGTSDGNNIVQHEDNGSDAQRWSIKSSNPSLSVSSTSVTVPVGSSVTVNCTCGGSINGYGVTYSISNVAVCSASWGGFNDRTDPLTITGKASGTTTIKVSYIDYDTDIVYDTKTITVTVPDTTKPTASLSSTNNVSASQTVTLSLSDTVGLAGYYWGTSSSYSNNPYTSVSGTSKSVTKTVSAAGTYYLTAKDTSGNISSTVSKTFYNTTLNAKSGSVSPSNVITASGNSFTLPKPTRTGYTFKNWNTASGGTGTAYSAGASYKPTGSSTLYAQWTPNNYTISYNANGGSGGPGSQTKTYGQTLTLSSTKPTRTGYTFKNWNTKANGSGTSYAAGASYTVNAAATLYAQWTPITYTVRFHSDGATSGTMSDQIFTYDVEQPLKKNAFICAYTVTYNYNGATDGDSIKTARIQHPFYGWCTRKVLEPVVDDYWEEDYGILSMPKDYDDKESVLNLTATNGEVIDLYASWSWDTIPVTLPTPTRIGYTFGGWYTDEALTKFAGAGGEQYNRWENITLYAKWIKDKGVLLFVDDITVNYKYHAAVIPQITVDEGAWYTVTYASSDPNVATVDENTGEIIGVNPGTATIKVKVTDSNGYSATKTCKVTVKYTLLQRIVKAFLFAIQKLWSR